MKNTFFQLIFSILFLCLIVISADAQSVDILYKVKGKNSYSATIFFSKDNGNPELTPDEFLGYENIFFTIKPNASSEREYFKSGDLEEYLNSIELLQDGKTIQPAKPINPVADSDEKILLLIMAFPKDKVRLYEPFNFKSPFIITDEIQLSDEYFTDFNKYKAIYEEGYNLCHENSYLNAFKVLFPVVEASITNEEILHYSFSNHLKDILMETIITKHADSLAGLYSDYSDKFRKSLKYEDLVRCDSVEMLVKQGYDAFSPYFKLNMPKSKEFQGNYDSLIVDLRKIKTQNLELFKKHKMAFFETGDYEKDYRFAFYIDLLARMVTHLEAFRPLNGLDTINPALLDRLPVQKASLVKTGWLDDFEIMIGLINNEIKYGHMVFNDSVMSNLYRQSTTQRQPFYEIFRAFNVMTRDHDLFHVMLEGAMKTCSDLELIRNIEMWILCRNLTIENVDSQVIENINQGISLIQEKKWEEAGQKFEVITMQASNLALPWYYAGIVSYELKEEHLAQNRFTLALEKYPRFISPRLYLYKNMYDLANYDPLLVNLNKSLEVMDIWLFNFWKAKVLYAKKQYKEAILVITEKCLVLNPYDFESWFLLGDAYFDLKDLNKAKEAYQQTQRINPYDYEKYSRIMQEKFGN